MLERRITPEGGLVYCDLGRMAPEDGQVIDCSLRLAEVLPDRRVVVAVELLEGETCLGARMVTIPAHPGGQAADVALAGVRFYLPQRAEGPLTLRADAYYLDRQACCLLPE